MVVNLGNNKCKNNNNSKCYINNIRISLLMSIVETSKKNVSNIDRKLYKRKVRTSSINSSSTLFSYSICAVYNRVHRSQNQRLMLKTYIPAINKSIFSKKLYENIFSRDFLYELYACIENHLHVIHSPNLKDSLFVKIDDNLVNKKKHLL